MIKNYIKIAYKVFLRRKFFTFISLFAISFTLVVLMVATAILDHIFSPMAPEVRQERTLALMRAKMWGEQDIQIGRPGYKLLDRYMRTLPGVEATSISSDQKIVSVYKEGYDLKPYLKRTDSNFWKILEFTFIEGGPITDGDERDANYVAVINRATRARYFGDEPAVGKTIEADRQRFRIIGVVENVPIYRTIPFSDIWVPISTTPEQDYKNELMGSFNGLILARGSGDFSRIKEDMATRLKSAELPSSEFTNIECVPGTAFDQVAGELLGNSGGHERSLLTGVLLLAAFLFMLLPTANLVNLNISRIIERSSEIGVRKSFGASSRTLIGQFLVENIILTFIGGAIGFTLSAVILRMLGDSGMIPYAAFSLNFRIFLYGFASIIIFGIISGVYPAWRMARMHPVDALKGVVR